MSGRPIAIIGTGAWGTTLALVAARAGNPVRLWFRDGNEAARVATTRIHQRRLPNVPLPSAIETTADLEAAVHGAAIVLLVVPSQTMRDTARAIAPLVGDTTVVSASKGLETGSLLRMTEVIEQEFRATGVQIMPAIAALSGPNLAGEIASGKPAGTVVAARTRGAAQHVARLLMSDAFRCYTSEDVVGVEMCGALKNIIAIGAGIGAGLESGENAKAAFISRGVAEIARLGIAAGAHPLTFAGLAGLGDLIATCSSELSRNHTVGRELARGRALNDILEQMGQVAEGVSTTRAARELGVRLNVELPITEQMYRVLFEGHPPIAAISELMRREPKDELTGSGSGLSSSD